MKRPWQFVARSIAWLVAGAMASLIVAWWRAWTLDIDPNHTRSANTWEGETFYPGGSPPLPPGADIPYRGMSGASLTVGVSQRAGALRVWAMAYAQNNPSYHPLETTVESALSSVWGWAPEPKTLQRTPQGYPENNSVAVIVDARGWPTCCLASCLVFDPQHRRRGMHAFSPMPVIPSAVQSMESRHPQYQPHLESGLPIPTSDSWVTGNLALPLRPLWTGLLLNTVFYAAVGRFVMAASLFLRRFSRLRRGLCPRCKYPKGESEVCTECGATT